jgi:HEPN domain-containing protein
MNPVHDEVKVWLLKAKGDLLSARILVKHSPLVLGPAAFHCQQAVEKSLKAFLVWRSVPPDLLPPISGEGDDRRGVEVA